MKDPIFICIVYYIYIILYYGLESPPTPRAPMADAPVAAAAAHAGGAALIPSPVYRDGQLHRWEYASQGTDVGRLGARVSLKEKEQREKERNTNTF